MNAVSLVNPQTLNLYTYCGNDPINYIDPLGLFFGSLFRWVSKIFNAIKRILAVVVAVVLIVASIINIGNPAIAAGTIKAALFLAAGLFAYAFGSSKLQAIIGIVATLSIRRVGIIVNIASQAGSSSLWKNLLGTFSTVGSISNFIIKPKRKKFSPPCPESGKEIAENPNLQKVWDMAQELSKQGGRFREVGGWILAKKGNDNFIVQIYADPRNKVDRTFGLNETAIQQAILGNRLRKGWYIIATFHTHGDSSPMNEYDIALSEAYKTPGIVIQPGGKAVPYGVEKGVWGIGIPKGCK